MVDDSGFRVIEFRNYLLRPNVLARFHSLFNKRFVKPMTALGGFTVRQYRVKGGPDRFVWLRAFANMQSRLEFLKAFYLESEIWKAHKNEANSMMVNSDNVFLLRPLAENGNMFEVNTSATRTNLQKSRQILVADFYICNGRLEQAIELFSKESSFASESGRRKSSLWVSEMSENQFPQLPAFQDKNLLVMLSEFDDEKEYLVNSQALDTSSDELKNKLPTVVTIHNRMVLQSFDD